MKISRILFSLLFIITISSSLLAESNFRLNLSLGYGYIINDTPQHMHDNKDYHLHTKFRPAISMEFRKHHLKLDYQYFGYEPVGLEDNISDELTAWNVKDLSLKYGRTILGENRLKLAAFAGAGLLVWERKYQKMFPRESTTDYYPTLPFELELSYAFEQRMKIGIYLFSDFNSEAKIMGAGISLYHKIF